MREASRTLTAIGFDLLVGPSTFTALTLLGLLVPPLFGLHLFAWLALCGVA